MNTIRLMTLIAATASVAARASPGQNTQQLTQERRACAAAGFDPGDSQFDQCVSNLDASIDETRRNNG
jgi:hypothetical protein